MPWKILLCVFCFLCCACQGRILLPPPILNNDKALELSILHVNDFHARFVETNLKSGVCDKNLDTKCIGGLPRLLSASRMLIKERPNAIFLDAGDHFSGTFWQTIYNWNATATFFTRLPFDASTFGNHDFDQNIAGLTPFLSKAKQPFVAANIDSSQETSFRQYYKPSVVIKRGNQKIGIIGIVTRETQTQSNPGKLKFTDELEAVKKEAAKLKAQGVKVIIVLSHCGLDVDRVIAANAPHVDVIVGGHTHSFLYTGKPPADDEPEDVYPVVVKQNNNSTVLVVQAKAFTKYLGNLTVWFDRRGEVTSWEGNPIFLDSSIVPDPELLEEMRPWEGHALEVAHSKVGESKVAMDNLECRSGECDLANLVTDAMVFSQKLSSDDPKHWTYAAIGLINAGALRASLPAGEITYGSVASVLPFANTWDVFDLRGEDLLTALEESVSRSSEKDRFYSASFLHWSGVKVKYDLSKPKYHRVVDVKVRCQACEEPTYEDLVKSQVYRIVTSSFILARGDAMVIHNKQRNRRLGDVDTSLMVEYIKKMSPIDSKLEQRVVLDGKYHP